MSRRIHELRTELKVVLKLIVYSLLMLLRTNLIINKHKSSIKVNLPLFFMLSKWKQGLFSGHMIEMVGRGVIFTGVDSFCRQNGTNFPSDIWVKKKCPTVATWLSNNLNSHKTKWQVLGSPSSSFLNKSTVTIKCTDLLE